MRISRNIPPFRRRVSLGLILGALLLTSVRAAAAYQAAAEPSHAAITSSPIGLALNRADVSVSISESAEWGQVEAAYSDDLGDGEGLEVVVRGGQILVSRDPGAANRRIRLDLVLRPDQELGIEGEDLAVVIEGPENGELAGGDALVALAVQSSQVHATRARGLAIGAVDSQIDLGACEGVVMLESTRSSVSVTSHFGELGITAVDSEILVSGLEGKITFVLEGGTLELERGGGEAFGEVVEASARFREWGGSLSAVARSSLIEVFGVAEPGTPVDLSGEESEFRVEDLGGELSVEMLGGRLEARRVGGAATITAHAGTSLDLEQLTAGQLTLNDAEAEVMDAAQLTVKLDHSQIELVGAGALRVEATSSAVRLAAIERLSQLVAEDSELDLDLRELLNPPSMRLTGRTVATVELPTPCVVRSKQSEILADSQIEVSGCEWDTGAGGGGRYGRSAWTAARRWC